MFSVIYTPTEGDAIQTYSRLFRRPEGCFLNIYDLDRIETSLSQFGECGRNEEIDYIVVTDGEEVSDTSTRTSSLQLTHPVQDSRNWRSGSGLDPHLSRETCSDHFMRWDPSLRTAAGGIGLRDRCIIPHLIYRRSRTLGLTFCHFAFFSRTKHC